VHALILCAERTAGKSITEALAHSVYWYTEKGCYEKKFFD